MSAQNAQLLAAELRFFTHNRREDAQISLPKPLIDQVVTILASYPDDFQS